MLRTTLINNMLFDNFIFWKTLFSKNGPDILSPHMQELFDNIDLLVIYLYPCSWLCKCITVLHKWGHANESATEGRRTILSLFCVKTTVHSELIRKKNVAIYARIFFFMYVYYYSAQYIVLTQVMSKNSVIKGSMCELRSVTECKWWWPAMPQASHTVILPDWTLKKWVLSNFALQHC